MNNHTSTTSDAQIAAVIATHRFGLGPKPGELRAAQTNPKEWLKAQIGTRVFNNPQQPLPTSSDLMLVYYQFRQTKKQLDEAEASGKKMLKQAQLELFAEKNKPVRHFENFINDSLNQAAMAKNSFAWRLLDFFRITLVYRPTTVA